MASHTPSLHERLRPPAGDAHHPAVVNVRRPSLMHAEIVPGQTRLDGLLDEGPLPPTVLRLPDLATSGGIVPARLGNIKPAAIAQWVGLGLGALLALWLIFGGHGSNQTNDEAPAWPATNKALTNAPAKSPTESPTEAAPPRWNVPAGQQAALAEPSAPPAHQPALPAQPAPQPSEMRIVPSPGASAPVDVAPIAPGAPRFDPFNQSQIGDPNATLPPPDDARAPAAFPSGARREPVYTASRPAAPAGPAAPADPSNAQPLNVTVPVPQ